MKKILVTGGAGYIGAHTTVALIDAGFEPIVVDNLIRSDLTLINRIEKITEKKLNFIEGDCCDEIFLNTVFTKNAIDCVIHFAALKSVGESVEDPLLYYDNNIGSLLTLLKVMKKHEVKNLIFSSSCTVYGQPDQIPVTENTPFKKAESPYGETKQICEQVLERTSTKGFSIVSLRYFNPIGAHPSAEIGEMPIGVPNNLVPFITQTAAGWRKSLTVFGNDYNTPDGSCVRDYIHIQDLAEAHVKSIELLNKTSKPFEAFNLGTGKGASVLELVNKFMDVTNVDLPYQIGARRPGDVEKVYADPSKANDLLNWTAQYSMEDALLHAWQWQQKLTKP